jgi:hypothetical protein
MLSEKSLKPPFLRHLSVMYSYLGFMPQISGIITNDAAESLNRNLVAEE